MDVSIVVPSIRTKNWQKLLDSLKDGCGKYSYELILVGPTDSQELQGSYAFIQDFGSPCRCGQLGSTIAKGEYITWSSDDGYFLPGGLESAIDLQKEVGKAGGENDVIAINYAEGPGFSGKGMPPEWFRAHHHADQRLPGIMPWYKIAPVGMYKLNFFRYLGGWDTRYEHLNMSCHDLAFRAQKAQANVHLSPKVVSTHDQTPGAADYQPIQEAYYKNDLPLFQSMYAVYDPNRVCIQYDNWMNSPITWRRFQ